MFHKNYLTALLLLGLCSPTLLSQIRINEYSAANWKAFYDDHNDHEDWIELYNAGNAPADLSGHWISDDAAEPRKFQFPAGTSIPAKGFLVLWCSGRNRRENGAIHTNFRLTQTKNTAEVLVLSAPGGMVLESVTAERTAVHQSRCRSTDGASTWRICTEPTLGKSNNGSTQYAGFAKRPDMDLTAGFYDTPQVLTMTTDEPGSVICYTLDGTEPTRASKVYTGPINLDSTKVVKARTFSPDRTLLPSFIRFNTYFIKESFSYPVFSIAADSLQDLANGADSIRPVGSIEYFDLDKTRASASYGELNGHGKDSWVNDQRSLDWISRDEMGYSRAITEPLFAYSDRDEYQRLIFRAAGDDNYPATDAPEHEGSCHLRDDYVQTLAQKGGLSLDIRASRRCVVFLNGRYWGIYYMRENPDDHDYTEHRYGQGKYDLQYLLTWDDTWAEYGGEKAHQDWRNLRDFILDNDMGKPENYRIAADSIDMLSMIDYFLVNLNVVASDWLNYNTGWWRGLNPEGGHRKWGYILWDLDATFDYYINYSGVPNTSTAAEPCDLEEISGFVQNNFFGGLFTDTCFTEVFPGFPDTFEFCRRTDGKHQLLFLKLLRENPEFRRLYYARQSDLMNSTFSCETMLSHFDSMVNALKPEMPRHIARWGGTMSKWQSNVNKMRFFITRRCAYFKTAMKRCYPELTGPYNVVVLTDPPGAGTVQFNTLTLQNFPWKGNYYAGMDQQLSAKPKDPVNMPFHHWESRKGNSLSPTPQSQDAFLRLEKADTLVAVFGKASSVQTLADGFAFRAYPSLATNFVHLEYALPQALPAQAALVNALGQPVATWDLGQREAGQHRQTLDWGDRHLPAGTYFLRWQAGSVQGGQVVTISDL